MANVKKTTIDAFKPQGRNANRHSQRGMGTLEASMRKHGYVAPMTAAADGEIIDGSARLETVANVFADDVLVVEHDGTRPIVMVRTDIKSADTPEARAISIAANRVAELNLAWDAQILLEDLASGVDFSGVFSQEELDAMLAGLVENEPVQDAGADLSKADELQEKWQVCAGQIWKLGKHRLACGDCTDASLISRLMQGERANIVFTDPPYGVAIGAKNRMLNSFQPSGRNLTDIEDDEMSPDDLKQRLLPAFQLIKTTVMADDCTVFMTAPQGGELCMMMMMMMRDAGLPIRHVLIWKKNAPTFSMGRLDYDYQHEPILLTWGKRHKRPMLGEHKTSVWEIDKPRASAEHPTMKPVELYVNAYLNNSDSGDIAYEPYCGSGTAIIASEQTNRLCRAIEISESYCAVILQRYQDSTGIEPVLIDG